MEAVLRIEVTDATWAFFRENYPRLYALVWSWCRGPHHEVEELVQDALLHAWRDRASFRGDDRFAWISGIAHHRLLERRRGDERRDRALRSLASADDSPTRPEDAAARSERNAALWRALERIGPEYADALLEHYGNGRSAREIAGERGESEKAVESRLHRAREALRRELGGAWNEHR